ncbi:MAG: DNA polymerase III subunit alpha [Candidatus Cryptobacteroides sp.]
MSFVHLHLHTQYSILDGLTSCKKLFARAQELGMEAVAITDHGNMFGVAEFLKCANDKSNKNPDKSYKVKPIVGCEVYVTRHFPHEEKQKGYYHLILLAKNYEGYKNLMKIVSKGHIEGFYYRPRIDHKVLEQYHENLICSSACLAGEIPQNILAGNLDKAREAIRWHKELFGDDYYLEVMLHKTEVPGLSLQTYEEQKKVNETIFRLGQEMGVKVIATNDVHFLRKEDGPVHDRLICLTTNANINDPNRLRYTQQEYLKSEEEMLSLFPDHPEAIANTAELAAKIEAYSIERPPILPKFNIEPAFLTDIDSHLKKYEAIINEGKAEGRGQDFYNSVAYLCHLTYEGARKRYGEVLSEEQSSRIEFELKTISKMGFPDYFLIVQDYIAAMRKQGYLVGPGRGSAAGSVVAYCLWITNLDPIKYQLLFERFLNPDRINMPDIDVDFENLTAAHEYVEKTYGADHVSRVITFGTMAAKSSIKDVARISEVSIEESNRLTKMVPDRLSEKVTRSYPFNPKLDELKKGFKIVEKEIDGQMKTFQEGLEEVDAKINLANCYRLVPEFIDELNNGSEINKEVLYYARELEGSVRQVGQHACATIIGPSNLTEHMPICLSKDKETGQDVWTSQYDGHYIESVGMLKMDFLGLNTLSIIHETLNNIKDRYNKEIDIEAIPIDDKATYELYGRGDTTVVFQFESEGMKTHLQRLHPERFEDLIAMNALYRPGPMDYIPDFIDRKLGLKPIEYDLPEMEEYLFDTYGITVYQEQVMLLSQKLAGFTKGQADTLRKAMGKKQIDTLMSLKDKFMAGGIANGHPEKVLDKIWKDWEKFAQYAFNKSHATCYAWVSYQTGYLKCHYTPEFLAANLSCNLSKMEEIKKIMADCRLHKIAVLIPDINESSNTFKVNRKGEIRFGFGGLKGFGSNMIDAILSVRNADGPFSDIWDFVERMSLNSAKDPKNNPSLNRKSLEILVSSGAFDSFGYKRSQFFVPGQSGQLFIDELIRYGDLYKTDKMENSVSLFGDAEELKPTRPSMPAFEGEENQLELLAKEKELVGMYLSAHPLNRYEFELTNFTTVQVVDLSDLISKCYQEQKGMTLSMGGLINSVEYGRSRSGNPFIKIVLEDYSGHIEIPFYGKDVDRFRPFLNEKEEVYIEGEIKAQYRPKDDKQDKTPSEYRFSVKEISSLGNVSQRFLKGFQVVLYADRLNAALRSNLVNVVKKHKGTCPLSIKLIDSKNKYQVELNSHKYAVNVNNDFVDSVRSLGLEYNIMK